MPENEINIKRYVKWAVWSVFGLFALITLLNSFAVVGSGSVGVVTRLGQVNREMQPGFNFKLPYVEGVTVMNVQVQKEQIDATAATIDLQDVTSTIALNYHLDHLQVSNVFVNLSADYKDRIIDPSLQESIKAVTAQYTASDLLAKRADVAAKITDLVTKKLQPRGILVDQVSVVDFAFSKEYQAAVTAKQTAQQQAEQAQYNLQKAQLDAQANQVQNAALSAEILEQQAIAKWDGHLPTYLGQGSMFNIPLSK